jgi:nucleotide-binding universal stress UspA family protein
MPQKAIRTILMPTDFSESAASALEWAQALAQAFEAKIVLLHAVDMVSYVWIPAGPASVPAPVPQDVEKRIMDVAQESLHTLAAKAPEVSRRIIRRGHPREVILEVAKEVDADVIVVGTHGRRGVSHLFIGSVAEHVVRHAPVPVVTMRGTGVVPPRPR